MTTGSIYLLTFPNGKVYVGQTINSLTRRLSEHRFSAKRADPKLAVHLAWRQHGAPNVLLLCECEVELLSELEVAFIALFQSYGCAGYNLTVGGERSPMLNPATAAKVAALARTPERIARNKAVHTGLKRSPETCLRISQALKGKMAGIPKSAEHRAKIGAAHRGISRNVGRKNSPETLAKMSESAFRRWAKERNSK